MKKFTAAPVLLLPIATIAHQSLLQAQSPVAPAPSLPNKAEEQSPSRYKDASGEKNIEPATATAASDSSSGAVDTQEEQVVTIVAERTAPLVGRAGAASQGSVGPEQLKNRPLLRPGELLETVPGAIVSQHSGSGKANQYYIRGFNLDHGTDLAVSLDGMPLNTPTHAHGQGYIDLNLLIPELVSQVRYRKGAYEADQGDFSSAGSVDISYARRLGLENGSEAQGQIPAVQSLEIGGFGRRRALVTGQAGTGLLYGLELEKYDGPWVLPEDYGKVNALLRYSRGVAANGYSVTLMTHHGNWDATDQVPRRAVDSGTIDRYGFIDPTDGGRTRRTSLSAQSVTPRGQLSAYAVDYGVNLFSNFTYFLDDPVHGDQFEQEDRRRIYGVQGRRDYATRWRDHTVVNSVGFQTRHDDICTVGLYRTAGRQRLSTVRQDKVRQTSVAPYLQNAVQWSSRLRSISGVRLDYYHFDVDSSVAANSGRANETLVSPKVELAYKGAPATEYYFAAGRGFHSNDARGATITVDPTDPTLPANRVNPLVRSRFSEVGVRLAQGQLHSTLALWGLDFDSELLFVGDAGTTEASRPSRRYGVEWTNYWTPRAYLTFDADFALSRGRFRDPEPAGNRIPGAVEGVVALGMAYAPPAGWGGALRLRYFGPRPLVEDNSVRSAGSALVNGQVHYRFGQGKRFTLSGFNLLNARVSDIDYFYESRLPGEPAGGVAGIHTHPAEKPSFRLAFVREF